mmetsp:Transcript_1712/g.10561  ORF Transcript_1712/g.10561 Transcript_1712/m.10561 type:complete len:82 (-) Transcript_1712:592-837(-)
MDGRRRNAWSLARWSGSEADEAIAHRPPRDGVGTRGRAWRRGNARARWDELPWTGPTEGRPPSGETYPSRKARAVTVDGLG